MKRTGKWLPAGNWPALAVVPLALGGLIATALGAHILRWEVIIWQASACGMALLVYSYSRMNTQMIELIKELNAARKHATMTRFDSPN